MSQTLLLTETAADAERDAQPRAGIDAALGAAFNTTGKKNSEFLMGDLIMYRERIGQIVGPSKMHGCYDILMNEKQVELQSLTNRKKGVMISRNSVVTYTHNNKKEEAVVEKVDMSFSPAIAYVRILRRNVSSVKIERIKSS